MYAATRVWVHMVRLTSVAILDFHLWLECDPEDADDIIVDLRKLNKSESHYDRFWEIMGTFLDEHDMKVDATRHSSTCSTPNAWSIKSLKQESFCMLPNTRLSSHSRMQIFHPTSGYCFHSALQTHGTNLQSTTSAYSMFP